VLVDNQTWLIDAGHELVEKKRSEGLAGFTPRQRLIHCFWVVDYSMRNAGDLVTARELEPDWHDVARRAAEALALPVATEVFGLREGELERRYFDMFDSLCAELRAR